jgi:hypothetical protein
VVGRHHELPTPRAAVEAHPEEAVGRPPLGGHRMEYPDPACRRRTQARTVPTRPRSEALAASPAARGWFPKGAGPRPRILSGPAAPANIDATSTGTGGWPGGHGRASALPPIGGPLGTAPGPPGDTGPTGPRRGAEDREQTGLPDRRVRSCRSWVLSSVEGPGQVCERDCCQRNLAVSGGHL